MKYLHIVLNNLFYSFSFDTIVSRSSADYKPIMRVLSEEIDLSSHNIVEVSSS